MMNIRKKKGIVSLVESAENQEENNDDLTVFIVSRLLCLSHFSYFQLSERRKGYNVSTKNINT